MFDHSNILAIAMMSLAVAAPAPAQDVTADTVAATVNGTDITIGHMIVVRDALSEQYDNLSPRHCSREYWTSWFSRRCWRKL